MKETLAYVYRGLKMPNEFRLAKSEKITKAKLKEINSAINILALAVMHRDSYINPESGASGNSKNLGGV